MRPSSPVQLVQSSDPGQTVQYSRKLLAVVEGYLVLCIEIRNPPCRVSFDGLV